MGWPKGQPRHHAPQRVEVQGPAEYAGVRVDHPRIIEATKLLHRQGRNLEDICRIVGMPQEVVQKYIRQANKEDDAEHVVDEISP